MMSLQVTAATDLREHTGKNDNEWATVFAIHNKYRGKKNDPKAIPVTIHFGPQTLALAKATIKKGLMFTVVGELDYDKVVDDSGSEKEFYKVHALQLSPPPKKAEADAEKS
ncbi:hypothetical protein AW736_26235 [Termitidicoccus mucosus]|uniref:Single-stranded DNA-binding protein n=2 Tax=Termitidicoccus mucosus TaxID=1184151 RepID=A0A178IQ66_9BACT|nr:hypothetical protein AW736_26235 [Opitutaceae bacterium TSB47]